jgi:hypothetical protein
MRVRSLDGLERNLDDTQIDYVYEVWKSKTEKYLYRNNWLEMSKLANGEYTHLLLEDIDRKEIGTFAKRYSMCFEDIVCDEDYAIVLVYKVPSNLKQAVLKRLMDDFDYIGKSLSINTDDTELAQIIQKENFQGLWYKSKNSLEKVVFYRADDLRASYQGFQSFLTSKFGKFGTRSPARNISSVSDELLCPIRCNLL